jgi:hypothetical protein
MTAWVSPGNAQGLETEEREWRRAWANQRALPVHSRALKRHLQHLEYVLLGRERHKRCTSSRKKEYELQGPRSATSNSELRPCPPWIGGGSRVSSQVHEVWGAATLRVGGQGRRRLDEDRRYRKRLHQDRETWRTSRGGPVVLVWC